MSELKGFPAAHRRSAQPQQLPILQTPHQLTGKSPFGVPLRGLPNGE